MRYPTPSSPRRRIRRAAGRTRVGSGVGFLSGGYESALADAIADQHRRERTPEQLAQSDAVKARAAAQRLAAETAANEALFQDEGWIYNCPIEESVFAQKARVRVFDKRVNKWVLWVHLGHDRGVTNADITAKLKEAFSLWFYDPTNETNTVTRFAVTNIATPTQYNTIPDSLNPPKPTKLHTGTDHTGKPESYRYTIELIPNMLGKFGHSEWVKVPGYQTVRELYAQPSLKQGGYAIAEVQFEYWGRADNMPWPVFRLNAGILPNNSEMLCPIQTDVLLAYAMGNEHTLPVAGTPPKTTGESFGDAAKTAEKYLATIGTTIALISGAYVVVKIAGRL